MTRQVYVNGAYVPYRQAAVHVEDRGFQFADAVYEVCEVKEGRVVDATRHIARLMRSLAALAIPVPMSERSLSHVMRETIRRNRVANGVVYLQVTRGVARRDFLPPTNISEPTLVCIARHVAPNAIAQRAEQGIAVITMPDPRWARCDIKTVMLLPAVLAKQEAARHGAQEVWFTDRDGLITEGASSNAWIVTDNGVVRTRALGPEILPGITRQGVTDSLRALGLAIEETAFTRDEAVAAREAFTTSATGTVMPVVRIDGAVIGNGRPGPTTLTLRTRFHEFVEVRAP